MQHNPADRVSHIGCPRAATVVVKRYGRDKVVADHGADVFDEDFETVYGVRGVLVECEHDGVMVIDRETREEIPGGEDAEYTLAEVAAMRRSGQVVAA